MANNAPCRQFTDEFKKQALKLTRSIGSLLLPHQPDILLKPLGNWVDQERARKLVVSPRRQAVTEVESEVARLRAENATLWVEREILKKSGGVLRERVEIRRAVSAELNLAPPGV